MPVTHRYKPDPKHPDLGDAFYDVVEAARFPETRLRFRNDRWASRIGLDGLSDAEWIEHFARFAPLPGNLEQPLALRYHGHQFRSYNPDLGDGRGFLFAQLRDAVDGRLLDLATKGSGQTPWSRRGDGRLTLKGGVREILASEMLEALGVYTSKNISLIETGEPLQRHDEPSPTRSAVLVRLGHSHIRFGSFQRLAFLGEGEDLARLLDFSIAHYWPEAAGEADRAGAFLDRVVDATAALAAEWFAAGFVHGVLNTDNTVITGESFDYGPWRFLPVLDQHFTAAYFDETGLYAFGRQPTALRWNLQRLAECLIHLSSQERMVASLERFSPRFHEALNRITRARLGLDPGNAAATDETDEAVGYFYAALSHGQVPFERAFFDLAGGARPERIAASPNRDIYALPAWTDAIASLRDATPAPAEALEHPYFARDEPVTMLIDEVEALWAPIAERDDWGAFEAKLAEIAILREAYAPLLAGVRRGE